MDCFRPMLTRKWLARHLKDLAPHGKYLEWITNIKVRKHALDGTFFVHIFLGDFNRDDPQAWRSDPNLVGTFSVLGESVGTGCRKCQKDREDQLQVTGQVPLTLALAERYLAGQIENLTPEKVVPYLQTNLHWRVAAVSILLFLLELALKTLWGQLLHVAFYRVSESTISVKTRINRKSHIGQQRRTCARRNSRSSRFSHQQRSHCSDGRR